MRVICALGALIAGCAVAMGAFGAHSLKSQISPEQLDTFRTGVQYLLIHSAAVAAMAFRGQGDRQFKATLIAMLLGACIFCASLTLLVVTPIRIFGAIAPVGGVLMISAWFGVAWQVWKAQGTKSP